MDKKTTGIIAYITWIGWIVAYCAGDKEGAKFHLNQALVIWIGSIINYVLIFMPLGMLGFIRYLFSLAIFAAWIFGLIAAIKEEENEIPVIGQIKLLK